MQSATLDVFKQNLANKLDAILDGDMTRSACGEFWIQKSFSGVEMSPAFARLLLEQLRSLEQRGDST